MIDYKIILGGLTILIGIISYSFYLRSVFQNKTKPEAYSWLIWGLLASITFFAQVSKGGGAGTWATALTAIVCLIISAVAFIKDNVKMKLIDGVCLIGATIGIGLWYYTNNPLFAVILSMVIGAMGFVPTFRKAVQDPKSETAITYSLNALKFAVALGALGAFNLVTTLYPVGMTLMNISLAGMIFFRRTTFIN